MNYSKLNLDQLTKKMNLLTDKEQNQLKGGFTVFRAIDLKNKEIDGSVSVTVSGNCGCSCEMRN
ncbi:hypothetical protein ACKUSY_01210 [Myroides odoratus]